MQNDTKAGIEKTRVRSAPKARNSLSNAQESCVELRTQQLAELHTFRFLPSYLCICRESRCSSSPLGTRWTVLGPLGGQHATRAWSPRFLEPSWGRLGFIFGKFLDGFLDDISILFSSYPLRHQHVVKPTKILFL